MFRAFLIFISLLEVRSDIRLIVSFILKINTIAYLSSLFSVVGRIRSFFVWNERSVHHRSFMKYKFFKFAPMLVFLVPHHHIPTLN